MQARQCPQMTTSFDLGKLDVPGTIRVVNFEPFPRLSFMCDGRVLVLIRMNAETQRKGQNTGIEVSASFAHLDDVQTMSLVSMILLACMAIHLWISCLDFVASYSPDEMIAHHPTIQRECFDFGRRTS